MDPYRVELLPPDEYGAVWQKKEDFPKWAVVPLASGRGRITLFKNSSGYEDYY